MAIEVKVPILPESVADATIAAWHKKPGDTVKRDENLVDIETDKVMLEIPSPAEGVLKDIVRNVGDTVVAEELLGFIEEGEVTEQAPAAAKAEPAAEKAAEAPKAAPAAAPAATVSADVLADLSPAVRRLVQQHAIDVSRIQGTGKGGRVVKADVLAAIEAAESAPAAQASAAAAEAPMTFVEGERPEKRVPMTRLRARIAERLVEAQQTAAMLTTFNEVNLKPVMDIRARYKDDFEKAHGVRLGFMSFFVRATVEALKRFPIVNASVDGHDIVYHGYYDIGIAVSSPRGLVVPIVRDANTLTMAKIEQEIRELGTKARDGKLTMEELTGGTFTITNGGVFGSLLSTPILNPPQSAILGMHKIAERPIVENGEVVVRPMMNLALSYDHRIIDGKDSVQFLVTIKELLEDPSRMLLEL